MWTIRNRFTNNVELAKVKNRAENMQMTRKLSLMDQQKHKEIAIINKMCQKFAKKNYKLRCATTNVNHQETPEVVLYETHTPGFCYRCNGEQKIPSVSLTTVTVEYDCLHDLVFTDDILDIEKLLVLHLISIHKSETLAPVLDPKLTNLIKDYSPAVRLLEKSRKTGFVVNKTMMDILPFYTIEIKNEETKSPKKSKSSKILTNIRTKMAHRILFNENLRKLISTVVAVLHSSNFPKFRQLVQLAHDPNSIRAMLAKPHIIEFIDFLSDQPIVNDCENFVLTPPFKLKTRDLNVQTVTESLEGLIKNLRANILQLPKKENRLTDKVEKDSEPTFKIVHTVKRNFSEVMTNNNDSSRVSRLSIISKLSNDEDYEQSYLPKYRRSTRNSEIPDFITKNIKEVGKTKKIEYDTIDDNKSSNLINARKSSVSSSRSRKLSTSVMKNSPLSKLDEVDRENSAERVEDGINIKETVTATSISPKIAVDENITNLAVLPNNSKMALTTNMNKSKLEEKFGTGYGKYHIKITTCKACMEKWREPLPTPKTPRVKKSNVLPYLKDQLYKTNSKHRIDMLINKELYNLESYDRRFSSTGSSKRSSKHESQTDSYDNININPMYLAKIEQEIRVKETRKKLEKFLSEPI